MLPASASSNNGRISDFEAGVSLAKAIMGAGSFALPWAFSKMGYIAGPIFMTIFLGLSVHSMGLLVDCACWVRKQRQQQRQRQQPHRAGLPGRGGTGLRERTPGYRRPQQDCLHDQEEGSRQERSGRGRHLGQVRGNPQ
mmetsp:Transcript_15010/g.31069  ORF Transcript_15010/g.31069 Transcript_15010/m.31069 type:complete len:139 (-) Transcript_15010:333-749(-)